MSQALPMTNSRRGYVYGRDNWTPRQQRQITLMGYREQFRREGLLPIHGATGVPTRRPIVRPSAPPERGSIRTHVAVRCDDRCGVHLKPRLHRVPRRGGS